MQNSDIHKQQYFLKAKLKKFEGLDAVIQTENNQTLKWPIQNLPPEINQGQEIRIIFSNTQTDEEDKVIIAKKILNEILQSNPDKL